MSLPLVSFLLVALAVYSYMFIRRAGHVQQTILLPFMYRLHAPKVISTITDEEHNGLHDQIDIFNLRIISCFVAACVATGVGGLFLMLAVNGGNATIAGYIMAFCYAYVGANYDLNTKIINWVRASENVLLARILQKNADDDGHDSLGDYIQAENEKLLKEWVDEIVSVGEEFDTRLRELGYDDDRDYLESPEAEQELIAMCEQVSQEMAEKDAETGEK